MKVATKLSLITGFTAAIMLTVGITSFVSITSLIQANQWVSHSKEVVQQINLLLYNLSDTVSTQRAYIISDKQPFFDAYQSQRAATQANIEDIRRLVADNPEQTERLKKVEILVKERLESLEITLKLYKEKGSAAAFERIRNGKSLQFRIDLQKAIGEMRQDEIDLLDKRDKELRKSVFSSEMTVGFGVSLALVFFALYNFLFSHSILNCIRQLITASENVKYGRFDLAASTSSNDEFADLAAAFNNIGQQLLVATNKLKQEKKSSDELTSKLEALTKALDLQRARLSDVSQLNQNEQSALAAQKTTINDLNSALSELSEMCRNMQGFELTGREHVQRITLLNDTAGSSARRVLANCEPPYDKSYAASIQNLRDRLIRVDEVSELHDQLISALELIAVSAEMENARSEVPNRLIDAMVKNLKEKCAEARINSKDIKSILSAVESGAAEVIGSINDCTERLSTSKESAANVCHELDKQSELCHELRILYEDSIVQKCVTLIRSKEKVGILLNDSHAELHQLAIQLARLLSHEPTEDVALDISI